MNQTLSLADLESFDTHAKRYGSERRFLCPICGNGKPRDDDHRSLALHVDTGVYICHRCKEKGLVKEKWTKQTFTPRKARETAALQRVFSANPLTMPAQVQTNTSEDEQRKAQSKIKRLQSNMKVWQAAFLDSPAQDYLQSRGIDPQTAKAFGCGYAEKWEHWEKDKAGKWQLVGTDRRVVFPVTNQQGEIVAFHGRAIDEVYIGSPKISKGDKSLGLFQTPGAFESDVLAICEGPIDAMALFQCGMSAAALIGTSAGDWLASALAFRKVMVGTDADPSGDEAAETLIADFRSRGARAVRLRPTDCKDWAEFLEKHGAEVLRDLLKQAAVDAFALCQITAPRLIPEDIAVEDVFSTKNESGQKVIDWLFAAAKKYEDSPGNDLLLCMPTYDAYESETDLVTGIRKHSAGDLPDNALKTLTRRFIDAHLLSNGVSLSWTGNEVPLFHLTLWIENKLRDNQICNQIQSWIIRQFWIRTYSETEIKIKCVKL